MAARILARLDLDRLQRVLEFGLRRPPRPAPDAGAIGRDYAATVDAIIRKGRPLVRTGCMTRGIVLYRLLRVEGMDVCLRFGLSRDASLGPAVTGHCWLELEGKPFLERTDPTVTFEPIATLSRFGVG